MWLNSRTTSLHDLFREDKTTLSKERIRNDLVAQTRVVNTGTSSKKR